MHLRSCISMLFMLDFVVALLFFDAPLLPDKLFRMSRF